MQRFGGRWTEEKLDHLTKYLRAYLVIFTRNPRAKFLQTLYVDAFAGTGAISLRRSEVPADQKLFEGEDEADAFFKGSAARALDLEPGFSRYLFIESNAARVNELRKLRNRYATKRVEIQKADANQYLTRWCKQENWTKTRAVVFLDPYATEVSWNVLVAIAETKAIDLWLLFPCMAFNRLLTRRGPPPAEWANRLTQIAGTDQWMHEFYPERSRETLFGSEDIREKDADFDSIGSFFLKRLRTIFAAVAPKPLVLRNSRNTPLFLLCFAAGNERGAPTSIKIASQIIGD